MVDRRWNDPLVVGGEGIDDATVADDLGDPPDDRLQQGRRVKAPRNKSPGHIGKHGQAMVGTLLGLAQAGSLECLGALIGQREKERALLGWKVVWCGEAKPEYPQGTRLHDYG